MNTWVVLPAAGVGSRMESSVPKQYMRLQGHYLIDQTLKLFINQPYFRNIIVVLSPDDEYWQDALFCGHPAVIRADGGAERADSVLAGLLKIEQEALADDWVLVHDVARPCLTKTDLERLLAIQKSEACGGLLAAPVRDTMKRSSDAFNMQYGQCVDHTVSRDNLWHALTPQMFRYQDLVDALTSARNSETPITDESSAMELAGYKPVLVKGSVRNIKVTYPEDLELAHFYLNQDTI